MRLHAGKKTLFVGHRRDRRCVIVCNYLETRWHRDYFVAVTHPYVEQAMSFAVGAVLDVAQQSRMAASTHFGITELADLAAFNFASKLRGHRLHAIADAEHRRTQLEYGFGRPRRSVFPHRCRAAR